MNTVHALTTLELAYFAAVWLLVGIAVYISVTGIRAELRAKRDAVDEFPQVKVLAFDEAVAWARTHRDERAAS